MDWNDCINKKITKQVKLDNNLIKSARKIANEKVISANSLEKSHYYAKISLFYDALREYLECIALENGYKIYNHECYTSFLREILKLRKESLIFDRLRKVRNGINYYGESVTQEKAELIINDLKILIKKFRK